MTPDSARPARHGPGDRAARRPSAWSRATIAHFFAGAVVLFVLLYLVAQLTLERPPDDGVIRLRWATDPNPARDLQTEIFGKLQVRLHDADVLDWPGFVRALLAAGPSPAAQPQRALARLWRALPEKAREALRRSARAAPGPEHRAAIVESVTAAFDRRDLFGPAELEGLALPYDARLLAERPRRKLTNVEVAALNRRVLEAALPGKVRQAVRIEVSVEPSAREKLIVQCATGVGPDVIDIYGQFHMMTLIEARVLVDLTACAERLGFGPKNTYPSIEGVLTAEGRQYRFPCNVWANCVVYNRRLFDKYQVAHPADDWTYDNFIRVCRQLLKRSDRKVLAVANWNSEWMFNDLLIGHGGRYFSPDGLVSRLDSTASITAMQLYHDMMHVHQVLPTPSEAAAMSSQGGWGSGGLAWFSNQRAAMIFIGRWYLCRAVKYPEIQKHLAAVRLPRVEGRRSAGVTDARGAGINVTSPHREAALKFLQYLAGREYGQVIVNDGDSLPPNPALARTGADLVNDVAPDPNFHRPFIEAMVPARPLDASPFIDAGQVKRWVGETTGKVENRLVTPAAAMRALAAEINRRIRRNLERRSDLRRKYEQITREPYADDWWRQRARHVR